MVQTTVTPSNQQTAIYNALVPKEGPRTILTPLDFTASASILIDFTQAYENTSFSVVQSVWVDNFANASPVVFTVASTGQTIEVPANAQGVFPVIAAIRPKITITSAGNVIVPCLWLTVPLPVGVWYKAGATGGGPVTIIGPLRSGAVETVPPIATPTGGGATSSVTGGTAVTVFAAGSIINGAVITNPAAATEPLGVSISAAAAGTTASGATFLLAPGQSFTCPPSTIAVTANALTAGHAFSAVQY